jgi:hypothetical protein
MRGVKFRVPEADNEPRLGAPLGIEVAVGEVSHAAEGIAYQPLFSPKR